MGIYALSALLSLLVAFLSGFHQHQLEKRLQQLNVLQDAQVKYFSNVSGLFGVIAWVALAFIFCVLMVRSDLAVLGL
jgi:hypothetical protein